jgi:hypothetical protein
MTLPPSIFLAAARNLRIRLARSFTRCCPSSAMAPGRALWSIPLAAPDIGVGRGISRVESEASVRF